MKYLISITLLLASGMPCFANKLLLLTAENIEPYVITAKHPTDPGIDVEIIHRVLTQLNLTFELLEVPRARALLMVKAKEADGLISTLPFEASRFDGLWLSNEMYNANFSLIVPRNRALKFHDFILGRSLVLGGVRGGSYPFAMKNTVLVRSDEALLNLLRMNRIDGVLTEEIIFFDSVHKFRLKHQFIVSENIKNKSVKFALRQDSKYIKIIKKQFNLALNDLKQEEFIDSLFVKYLPLELKYENESKQHVTQ